MKIDLAGKRAIVTGASGQLGYVMALTLAKCGADIIAHYYKNKKRALMLKDEIEMTGRKCMIIQADITKIKPVVEMGKYIEKKFGLPDIIINNAVMQTTWAEILNQTSEAYFDQFTSSVMHNVNMIKVFVPKMIENRFGRVIAINTECSMQNDLKSSAYIVGKRGMDGLLRVLAKEIGEHNITVNQIAPGWTISEKDRENGTIEQAAYSANVPLKRRGTDQEIANVVAFIASDLASFITGAFIPVCGGNVMPAI